MTVAEQLNVNESTRVDRVGHSGIYPASGPPAPAAAVVRTQGALAHPEERRRLPASTDAGPWPGNKLWLGLGRAILGGYFIYNGINHFRQRAMLASYARSKQVPVADVAVPASGLLLLLGGLSVLTGVRPKAGASMIAAFLLSVSPEMHDFWRVQDPQQRMHEFVNFSKNMALLGAASLIAAVPEPWPASPATS
jgi:uncharacterized membrane protein YphA (DoxX/SURF4 family)